MQALWRTLRSPNDQVAHVAFRVLGKFGGGNRKMMVEPQALAYSSAASTDPDAPVVAAASSSTYSGITLLKILFISIIHFESHSHALSA